MPGSPTSRWATPRIHRSDHGANSPPSSPAMPPRPKRSMRCWRRFARPTTTARGCSSATARSLFFVDFTGSGDGLAFELPPGIHVLENRALGETSPKVDLVREALDSTPTSDGRAGGAGLPPHSDRPPEPRRRRAAERRQLRPPRDVRDSVVVHCARAIRERAAAPVGGRRTALHHPLRGRGRPLGRPYPPRLRLSPGRAACSAGGAAGRRRRRAACGDPPRSH